MNEQFKPSAELVALVNGALPQPSVLHYWGVSWLMNMDHVWLGDGPKPKRIDEVVKYIPDGFLCDEIKHRLECEKLSHADRIRVHKLTMERFLKPGT